MALSDILGNSRMYQAFVRMIVPPIHEMDTRFFAHGPDDRVLDIGCGPASKTHYFVDADYTGIDISEAYIQTANTQYAGRQNIRFICADINDYFSEGRAIADSEKFDLIILSGVLHHLKDEEAHRCLGAAARVLRPRGELRTLDGVYEARQSWLARQLLRWDRGQYVRDEAGYRALLVPYFAGIRGEVVRDRLRVPYTHLVLTAFDANGSHAPVSRAHGTERA